MFGKYSGISRTSRKLCQNSFAKSDTIMASVKVILRANKTNKAGLAPLYLQIIHERNTKEVTLKKYIDPKFWNKEKRAVRSSHSSAKPLNVHLSNELKAYETIINVKLAKEEQFTIDDIINERSGKALAPNEAGSFIAFMEDYANTNPENLAFHTINSYKTCLSKLKEFSPELSFQEFTYEWLLSFEKHLIKQGQAVNTIADKMKVLIKLSKLCLRNGYITQNPFEHYIQKTEPGTREFLTQDELRQFKAYVVTFPTHILVKDVFLFACYTGLRFSDLATLTPKNIQQGKDDKGGPVYRLSLRMQKTSDNLNMKLPKPAVEILLKHGYPDSPYVFPILNLAHKIDTEPALKGEISRRNAYFNKIMKKLCERAGIEKSISMHCARHTFATLSLDLGNPIEVVSKLLGHKNLRETQIYAKILDKNKDMAMDAWNNI